MRSCQASSLPSKALKLTTKQKDKRRLKNGRREEFGDEELPTQ
jgi:hypothetical protein